MLSNDEVNKMFESAMKDPTLLSTIDINSLLSSIEDSKNDYLENKTTEIINKDIFDSVNAFPINMETKESYCDKLIGYRLVLELNELHKGKHIRWIRKNNSKLTNGGIIVDIKFLDEGVHILCMGNGKRFVQIKFDDCVIYQKMSEAEQLIVMAYEYVDNNDNK